MCQGPRTRRTWRGSTSSCTKTAGGAAASGSCAFVIPSTIAAGTYELRLFANGQYSLLATSNTFTVTAPGGPTFGRHAHDDCTRQLGDRVVERDCRADDDRLDGALCARGQSDAFLAWVYVSCTKTPGGAAASGSCAFVIPSTVAAGTYELRLFANGRFSLLATSNTFQAQ